MPSAAAPRPPLEPEALRAAAGPEWTVRLLAEAPSTNAVAAAEAEPGLVVVADHQTAGRGRLDRSWETPPGAALTFSVVVDPGVADQHWPLLPLGAAVAVAEGVRRAAGPDSGLELGLKWPNDVLLGEEKLAGILLERIHPRAGASPLVVVGIGLNVGQTREQLPVPTATSLAVAGAEVDRTRLFGAVLTELAGMLAGFRRDPGQVLAAYRQLCVTLGARVDVHLPGGGHLVGVATEVDRQGRLVVDGKAVGAGDVVHVRPRS